MNVSTIGAAYTLSTIYRTTGYVPMGWEELVAQMIHHEADLQRLVYSEVELSTYRGVYLPCVGCLPSQLDVLL